MKIGWPELIFPPINLLNYPLLYRDYEIEEEILELYYLDKEELYD